MNMLIIFLIEIVTAINFNPVIRYMYIKIEIYDCAIEHRYTINHFNMAPRAFLQIILKIFITEIKLEIIFNRASISNCNLYIPTLKKCEHFEYTEIDSLSIYNLFRFVNISKS